MRTRTGEREVGSESRQAGESRCWGMKMKGKRRIANAVHPTVRQACKGKERERAFVLQMEN